MSQRHGSIAGILLVFFLSGISGLIYQTVWLRILTRVLGNTVYATSIVIGAFMAGLALGSYVLGRYAARAGNLLRLYAALEMGVGLAALMLLPLVDALVPLYRFVYPLLDAQRLWLSLFQSLVMFTLLLIPTMLMGGTLPLLSAHTKTYHADFTRRLGKLYGLNTLGAFVGVAGSGFYFIGALGETRTVLLGVAINFIVALLALALAKKELPAAASVQPAQAENNSRPAARYGTTARKAVILAYGLNGCISIAYEIVWSRIFQVQVGTSIYAFSLMLGWYLLGIASGSLWCGTVIDRIKNPLRLFAGAQLFVACYSIIGMYVFALFEPVSFMSSLQLRNVLVMPCVIVFPVTFVLGLMFPAVAKVCVAQESEVGGTVGTIYAVNTCGCIIGSFVCGFILIGALGTKGTMLFLAVLNILLGMLLVCLPAGGKTGAPAVVWGSIAAVATLVMGSMLPDPFMTAVKKAIATVWKNDAGRIELYYNKESVAATTTVFGLRNDPVSRQLWINGVGMTRLCTETKIMAHLPLLLNSNPENILIICFGMGTTLRSAWTHTRLRCDVVELVPELFDCFGYFHSNAQTILADSRVRCYADDGRNFLMMRSKKYDVITIDPPPPVWSAGAVNLYSKEFFELCKEHLQPDGLMCLWIPPVELSEALMIMKTFHTVFPNTSVWGGPFDPDGEFLIGLRDDAAPDLRRLRQPPAEAAILADLNEWDRLFPELDALKKLLLLSPEQVALLGRGVPVITDDRPYTEFPLWRSMFDPAYRAILTARQLAAWRDALLQSR